MTNVHGNSNRVATGIEISKQLVLTNSASSILAFGLNMCLAVWLQQFLLKRITAAEYSLIPVITSLMAFAQLVTIVLTGGLSRYSLTAYANKDETLVTRIVSTIFPFLCAAAMIFLVLGSYVAWHIDKVLTIEPYLLHDARIMMFLLTASAALRLPLAPFGTGFAVRQKYILDNAINLMGQILRIGLTLLLLFGLATRVLWVVTASVTADLATLIFGRMVSMRLLPCLRFHPSYFDWPLARELVSFGGWTLVAELAGTIRTNADPIILNKLAMPMDIVCYNLGSSPSDYIQNIHIRARSPLSPAVMGMYATKDSERLRNTYLRIGRYSLWTSLALVLPGIIFRHEIITLYVGGQYAVASSVLALMLCIFPISYGNALTPLLASAANKMKSYSLRVVAQHTLNLAITIFFVGKMKLGALGSALGTVLAAAVSQPLLLFPMGLNLTHTPLRLWLRATIMPGFIPSLLSLPIFFAARFFLQPHSWLGLFISIGVGEIAYVTVLLTLCLQKADRQDIRGVLATIGRRLAL